MRESGIVEGRGRIFLPLRKTSRKIPGALELNETFNLLAILQTSKISAADEGLRIHDARAYPTPVNY
jgi:hypothetical protein